MTRLFPLNLYAIKAPFNSTPEDIQRIIFSNIPDDNTFDYIGRISKDDIFFDCSEYTCDKDTITDPPYEYERRFREILLANGLYWINPIDKPKNATLFSVGVPMDKYLSDIAIIASIHNNWQEKENEKLTETDVLLIIAPYNNE